jgi:hypothetical protein
MVDYCFVNTALEMMERFKSDIIIYWPNKNLTLAL